MRIWCSGRCLNVTGWVAESPPTRRTEDIYIHIYIIIHTYRPVDRLAGRQPIRKATPIPRSAYEALFSSTRWILDDLGIVRFGPLLLRPAARRLSTLRLLDIHVRRWWRSVQPSYSCFERRCPRIWSKRPLSSASAGERPTDPFLKNCDK